MLSCFNILTCFILLFLQGCIAGGNPVNVVVTFRGKKYQVSGSSVSDIKSEIEEKAGLEATQQSVLFKGKLLSEDEDLEAAGVSDGDTVNVLPSKKARTERVATESSDTVSSETTSINPMGGLGSFPGLPEGFSDLSPEDYRKMMNEVLNSPMMDEFFGSPEKIEESRKAILDNPMLKQAMEQLPGFAEMLEDPDKWMESMLQAKEMLEQQRKMQNNNPSIFDETNDMDD